MVSHFSMEMKFNWARGCIKLDLVSSFLIKITTKGDRPSTANGWCHSANIYKPNLNTSDDKKGIEWGNKKARRLLERSISPVKIQLQPFCKGGYISIQLRNSMTLNPFLWWWMWLKNELQNYGVDLHKINWTAFYCMLIEFLPSPAWRL